MTYLAHYKDTLSCFLSVSCFQDTRRYFIQPAGLPPSALNNFQYPLRTSLPAVMNGFLVFKMDLSWELFFSKNTYRRDWLCSKWYRDPHHHGKKRHLMVTETFESVFCFVKWGTTFWSKICFSILILSVNAFALCKGSRKMTRWEILFKKNK